ncbi:MAG TPA: hypothetical protein VIV54_17735 [Burkholderiales bacterium]
MVVAFVDVSPEALPPALALPEVLPCVVLLPTLEPVLEVSLDFDVLELEPPAALGVELLFIVEPDEDVSLSFFSFLFFS